MNYSSFLAQCVMCYRTAAGQQAERARILDVGILILLIPPLLILAGLLGLAWYRNRGARPGEHDSRTFAAGAGSPPYRTPPEPGTPY